MYRVQPRSKDRKCSMISAPRAVKVHERFKLSDAEGSELSRVEQRHLGSYLTVKFHTLTIRSFSPFSFSLCTIVVRGRSCQNCLMSGNTSLMLSFRQMASKSYKTSGSLNFRFGKNLRLTPGRARGSLKCRQRQSRAENTNTMRGKTLGQRCRMAE